MSELVIETSGLRKVHRSGRGRVVSLDGLDLAVPRGGVHGLLGPGGAGKSTLLRILVGLSRPTRGSVRVLGEPVPRRLSRVVDRVGVMVEGPSFVDHQSGRRSLRLLARSRRLPADAVERALERVGLSQEAKHCFGTYSAGQRQRLGVAAALLKSPELLLLDEPTLGMGDTEVRDFQLLLDGLAEDGVTVVVGTHDLDEVRRCCDSVSMLDRGRLLAAGAVGELLGAGAARTRIVVAWPDQARAVLEGAGHHVHRDGEALLVEGHHRPEELSRLLAQGGHYVAELSAVHPTLDSLYADLGRRTPEQEAS